VTVNKISLPKSRDWLSWGHGTSTMHRSLPYFPPDVASPLQYTSLHSPLTSSCLIGSKGLHCVSWHALEGAGGECNLRYSTKFPSLLLWLYSPFLGHGRFISLFILYTVGRTLWTGDQPVAIPLPTHRTTQTQIKRTQTSMNGVGFEPTIPVLERAKTVHASDRAAIVIGPFL
jgi:hypothetical protein